MYLMRSNYFAVRDMAAFEAFCERHDMKMITESRDTVRCGFLSPREVMFEDEMEDDLEDDEDEEEGESDWMSALASHIADGEVAVVMQVGNDKMRFLAAHAWAVNSQGATQELDLDEIYMRAGALGRVATLAQY